MPCEDEDGADVQQDEKGIHTPEEVMAPVHHGAALASLHTCTGVVAAAVGPGAAAAVSDWSLLL